MNLSKIIRAPIFAAAMLFASIGAASADEVVNALPDRVAMDGFDVVAYFDNGAPRKGSSAHAVDYKGKTWHFSSEENAKNFAANPSDYEPQHNGWCSYAVSEGYGAEVDFVNGWAIIDGKLYLNWNEETRDLFVDEQKDRVNKAQSNWASVHAGLKDGSVALYTHAGEGVDISHPQQVQ